MNAFFEQIAVIIPALNEAESVAYSISLWKALGIDFIRVVDNGSSDGTAQMAWVAGANVVFESRRGYGAAAWRGIQNLPSRISWVIFSSADGSDRLTAEQLVEWNNHAEAGFDVVMGNRMAWRESRRRLKFLQRLGNRLCCWLIWFGWGKRFADIGSLRLLRLDSLRRLHLEDRGFGWNIEMQIKAVELGLRLLELPVMYDPRRAGSSKISGSWRGTLKAGRQMLETLVNLWVSNGSIINHVYPAVNRE